MVTSSKIKTKTQGCKAKSEILSDQLFNFKLSWEKQKDIKSYSPGDIRNLSQDTRKNITSLKWDK